MLTKDEAALVYRCIALAHPDASAAHKLIERETSSLSVTPVAVTVTTTKQPKSPWEDIAPGIRRFALTEGGKAQGWLYQVKDTVDNNWSTPVFVPR